ncbi:cellulose biosynthesis cyclic di-GMP-binding regulatory protein BcsB [Pseudoalteromonas sp. G4]|uniref:cellulose biosynthesis cyclic di-GMP-binding regulatory protein BcsB n=1 Tax=Pseudoalteromonas sp. G4 TaxID=2992761 RepID=UPI00237EAE7E|nr:cellulose biosynthesis cyclic di-GMP-binding regulatory protein BcsB [Pseudoalteromonas sp. G4]MDE3270404.1 cellulose biosynthesis cyclic di-GMP-binding regulatory protein BcsB [Pseudoalteromonas sp. G4]
MKLIKFLLLCCFVFSGCITAKTLKVPLTEVYPVESLDLRCIDAKYEMKLPIPARWQVNSAKLFFSYVNSASLLKKNSQLVVRLNGTPLAQMKLDPNAPEGQAEIDLPSLLLQPGYNDLVFEVNQHYATQCELPCVPELWTRLKLDQAYMEFDYTLAPLPKQLSLVANTLFDERSFLDNNINIVTENYSDESLSVAGSIASGIGVRFNFQPTNFHARNSLIEKMDNIVIGSEQFISEFLAKYGLNPSIETPTVTILSMVKSEFDEQGNQEFIEDSKYALILIAGNSQKEIQLAAESFDVLSLPFPDTNTMKLHEFELPDIRMYAGKNTLATGADYEFKKLDFTTHTFRGFSGSQKTINFRLPSDFMIKPNQYVDLSLNYAYGAGSRTDSSLNVLLNKQYVASIHLDDPRGGLISNYQISMPTYLFQEGNNSISFQPTMTPLVTENCSFIQTENLFLTLFDNSSMRFPAMPHKIEMPRLDLMFVNGFPFTRWPDGFEARIALTELNENTVASAYNMMAVLGQKNGYPMISMQITSNVDANYDGEQIIISTMSALPKSFAENAPLKMGDRLRVPYPIYQELEGETNVAISTQQSDISFDKGMIMQYQSPGVLGRSVVLFTAKTDKALRRLTRLTTQGALQSQIKGDLVMVDMFDTSQENSLSQAKFAAVAVTVGDKYITGKAGKVNVVESVLVSNPNLYWIAIIVSILLFSLLYYLLLKRRRAMRQENES